jgi:hypothetical protein
MTRSVPSGQSCVSPFLSGPPRLLQEPGNLSEYRVENVLKSECLAERSGIFAAVLCISAQAESTLLSTAPRCVMEISHLRRGDSEGQPAHPDVRHCMRKVVVRKPNRTQIFQRHLHN